MKTVLMAGHAPAQNQIWRDELLATGLWDVLEPVHSFAAARVLLHRHNPDLLISELKLLDGTVLDMIRVLRLGLGYLKAQILVVARGEGNPLLLDALQEGADNFHDPSDPKAEPLATHARDTLAGNADIAPWIARHLLDHFDSRLPPATRLANPIDELTSPLALTADERLLLRQLAIGRRLGEVARYEKVSPRALAAKVRAIYRKMQWDLRAGDLTLQAA
ncbi:hypothetical protein [Aquabacterium sp.]|uniref:hypothetical protein n=1 Tax=Aquabacterium sp. TaxID=1872578 RepID=UPI003783824E